MKHISKKASSCIFAFFVMLFGSSGLAAAGMSVAEINKNPSALSDITATNCDLSGLNISNAVIKNLVMENVQAYETQYANITFENCTFTNVHFLRSVFTNVAFKNCKFFSSDGSDALNKICRFDNAVFNNVLFEKAEFRQVGLKNIDGKGGFVLFSGITDAVPRNEESFIELKNAQIRVRNSSIRGKIVGKENVDSITKDSKYTQQSGISSDTTIILNSEIQQSGVLSSKLLVIKDSVLHGDGLAYITGQAYFVDNTYIAVNETIPEGITYLVGFGIRAQAAAHVYILGKPDQTAAVAIFGGHVTIKNLNISSIIAGIPSTAAPDIAALNLQNVTINGGFLQRDICSGRWENVRILPPVVVVEAGIRNVQAFNLAFPKGEPWKKENARDIDIQLSSAPFQWPALRVPTGDELGLVWWPAVEPGHSAPEGSRR